MKRRNFIRNAAVSAIGLGFYTPDVLANPLTFKGDSVAHWLREFGWALSGRRRFKAKIASDAFEQITSATNDLFAKRGYRLGSDALCFLGEQENCCFYPLILRHTAFGTPPFVVPVFHRQKDSWSLVVVLDGFEVEAISRASVALKDNAPSVLHNLLIPTEKAKPYLGASAYKTQDGLVAIKTVQSGGKAQTTCTVIGREGKVFSETFVSRHCIMA